MKNKDLVNSFFNASLQSKELLASDDKQWEKIKKLVKTKDNKIFQSLKQEYIKGIIKEFTKDDISELKKVYEILSNEAGANYVSKNVPFDETIFWLK